MNDGAKTKDKLIAEVQELRRQLEHARQGKPANLTDELVQVQLKLALQLMEARYLEDKLRSCVEAAKSIAGMDAGGVYLRDQATGALRLVFADGLSQRFVAQALHYPVDSPNAQLIMKGEPVHVDYQQVQASLEDIPAKEGLRAASIFPIRYEGEVIGCLNVAPRTLSEISPSKRHALQTIVSQVANSVARARAGEALGSNSLRLRQAQALALLGSWSWDARTGLVIASEVLCDIFEVERGETDPGAFVAVVHPDDR